ncbi:MAG: hypothetical protein R2860_04965 [Desulfobacterales bacterium]
MQLPLPKHIDEEKSAECQ